MDVKFCPPTWFGVPADFSRLDVYPWMENLPKNKKIFCAFWCGWNRNVQLPLDYDFYLISYHVENVNLDWIRAQRQRVGGKFLVLFPGNSYDFHIDNTVFLSYTTWHKDIAKMINWHGIQDIPQEKKFKYSAVCNRVTQSKIWVTTKLLESARDESLILINTWIENKNVHGWQKTNVPILDELTDIYVAKYQNLTISDGFEQTDNVQRINSNPWQPQYTQTALHFTNNSFHYSYMQEHGHEYIYPGPDIDEKLLKCLVAGTPFVACGQFEMYKTLQDLGLNFDYEFDLSWDNDPGNLSRFQNIITLIDHLNTMSVADIQDATADATAHNTEFVRGQGFYSRCETANQESLQKLFDLIT